MKLGRYMMMHTALFAAAILTASTLLYLAHEHRETAARARELARTLERLLEVQLVGIEAAGRPAGSFPDWQVISLALGDRTGCVRLLRANGQPWRSECRGGGTTAFAAPRWFVALYRAAFTPGAVVVRSIEDGRGPIALLQLAPDPMVEIAASWHEARRLGRLTAAAVLALGLSVLVLTGRALRPTAAILAGLERMARGERSIRLAPGRFEEFARITSACNALAAHLGESESARAILATRLLRVQDEERIHLARELHDEFGQHLTAITALAASVRHGRGVQDRAAAVALLRLEESACHLQDLLRSMLSTLRPPGIDEFGLSASLERLARDWRQRSEMHIDLATDGAFGTLPSVLLVHLYRIVQECLTNAARHAAATDVRVRLVRRRSTDGDASEAREVVVLEVADNGTSGGADLPARRQHGWLGIEERVAALRGRITRGTAAGQGFSLRAVIPIPEPES